MFFSYKPEHNSVEEPRPDSSASNQPDAHAYPIVTPKEVIKEIDEDIIKFNLSNNNNNADTNPNIAYITEKVTSLIRTYFEKRLKFYKLLEELESDPNSEQVRVIIFNYEQLLQQMYFAQHKPSHATIAELERSIKHDVLGERQKYFLERRLVVYRNKVRIIEIHAALIIMTLYKNIEKDKEHTSQLLLQSLALRAQTYQISRLTDNKHLLYLNVDHLKSTTDKALANSLLMVCNSLLSLQIVQSIYAYKFFLLFEYCQNDVFEQKQIEKHLRQLENILQDYKVFHEKYYAKFYRETLGSIVWQPAEPRKMMIIDADTLCELESMAELVGTPFEFQEDLFKYCDLGPAIPMATEQTSSQLPVGARLRLTL